MDNFILTCTQFSEHIFVQTYILPISFVDSKQAIHSEVIGYKHRLKCNNCAYGILLYPVGKASIFFWITWIYISIYLLEMGTTSTFWYDQLLNPRNFAWQTYICYAFFFLNWSNRYTVTHGKCWKLKWSFEAICILCIATYIVHCTSFKVYSMTHFPTSATVWCEELKKKQLWKSL